MMRFGAILFLTLFGIALGLNGRQHRREMEVSDPKIAANETNVDHDDVIYGEREANDELLYKNIIPLKVFFLKLYENLDIVFPDRQTDKPVEKITKIVIRNNKSDHKRWSAKISKGGLGRHYVSLRVKSRKDMDVAVEVYGYARKQVLRH